ncbi:MAG: hypothetical protein ACTHZI_02425 [Luteimonas sp.]
MSGITIEARFNAAVSSLVAVLENENPARALDVTGAMHLLVEVKPRTARAIAIDLEGWLAWWQDCGRLAGRGLHQSVTAYLEHSLGIGLSPKTTVRRRYSIRRALAALGCPAEESPVARSIELLTCHATNERNRWIHLETTPFGWDKIRKCVTSADPDNWRDVKALAGMLVLYEGMAWSDQIFGHYSGGIWHASPARRDDLQRIPGGGGRLCLAPMRQDDGARFVLLSPLAMEWLERAHRSDESRNAALLVGPGGDSLRLRTWEKWIRALLLRSGLDSERFSPASLRLGMARDLYAAGVTVDEVMRDGGWATHHPIVRLLHGKSRSGGAHKARRRREWISSHTCVRQARSAGGDEAVATQLCFPGI